VAATPTVHTADARADFRPEDLEPFRRELTGYCYRMLGSSFEAEDAVQETMVRAWRNADRFEGRSALRSWLYRIATNVCLDQLRGRKRRASPMDMGPSVPADSPLGPRLPAHTWVGPVPDERVLDLEGDPADVASARESIRLAFVAALQKLPARQRAVLILREVLRWQATEVADLLETSVASVNSALQRARATLADQTEESVPAKPIDAEQEELLARYVDAFERYDITALVALLHDDAVMSMPPYQLWLRGPEEMAKFFAGTGAKCENSRLVPVFANGMAAFGCYNSDPAGGYTPWAIQVIEVADGRIVGHHNFLGPELFPVFGLPDRIAA
jgi:RNA polymerase sigma-70 factor, ECF subfamily